VDLLRHHRHVLRCRFIPDRARASAAEFSLTPIVKPELTGDESLIT
jgi:hypothetical protein